jgi:hypothetical protein
MIDQGSLDTRSDRSLLLVQSSFCRFFVRAVRKRWELKAAYSVRRDSAAHDVDNSERKDEA